MDCMFKISFFPAEKVILADYSEISLLYYILPNTIESEKQASIYALQTISLISIKLSAIRVLF